MIGATISYRFIGTRCFSFTTLVKRPINSSSWFVSHILDRFSQEQFHCNYSTRDNSTKFKIHGHELLKAGHGNLLQNLHKSSLISGSCFHPYPVPSFRILIVRNVTTNGNKQTDGKDKNEACDSSITNTESLTLFQRFKQMYRDYWYVLVPVHVITSLGWFAGFYYLAKSGVDVIDLLERMSISEKLINPLRDSSAGYIALAYALYKIATPVRYFITLGGTTISINYLKEWGYIKPIPPREKLKEMYQEKKATLIRETTEEIKLRQEKLKKTHENIIKGYRERADNKHEK